ncbi:hypothetical protein [Streptomyces sp. NPDC056296]|uniref:hypothetical protein n=1 Tax=Streptomyces sp. NPDC056296 TaxID=3345775 RepID=UPI0035D7F8AD
MARRVTTAVHDVRDALPLPDDSVNAVFAHMLLCMACRPRRCMRRSLSSPVSCPARWHFRPHRAPHR